MNSGACSTQHSNWPCWVAPLVGCGAVHAPWGQPGNMPDQRGWWGMMVRPCVVRLRAVRAMGQPRVHRERKPVRAVCSQVRVCLKSCRCHFCCVGLFLSDVVRRRVCHNLPKTVFVRWCHSAAFDIASLALDDGSCREKFCRSSCISVLTLFNCCDEPVVGYFCSDEPGAMVC